MILRTVAVQYHLQEGATFHRKKAMWRFLHGIAALGYHLTSLSEIDNVYEGWRQTLSGRPRIPGSAVSNNLNDFFTSGISAVLHSEMTTFVEEKGRKFWVSAFSIVRSGPLSGFKFDISFDATTSLMAITLTTNAFIANPIESYQVFLHWLDLFQVMYRIWHPIYGHSFSAEADWPEPTSEELRTCCASNLYEINFLSPDFVEQLGREQVLSTPGWKVQSLDDGGVLIVPELIFADQNPELWKELVQHLGMVKSFRGKY